MTRQYLLKYFLTPEKFKKFMEFIKDMRLLHKDIAGIDGEGKKPDTISKMIKAKRIRITLANRVVEACRKESKELIEKYKDLKF